MLEWLYKIRLRARSIFRRAQVDRELDEELRFHLEQRIAHEMARGQTPDDARQIALRAMGGVEQRKEECRDVRHTNLVDNLDRDVRYAIRALVRSPAFSITALLALALGIGANTAVFSVVNAILLRPLAFPEPDRLVMIFEASDESGEERGTASIADFLDWKARARSFDTLDALGTNVSTLTGDGESEQIRGLAVTATFFDALGTRPLIGRTFAVGDDAPGRTRSVVISERLWRRRYAADTAIEGRNVTINGHRSTVIGVMPASFRFGLRDDDVWTILTLSPPVRRGPFFLRGVARLKPGVSVDRAAAEMDAVAREVERANPKDYTHLRFPVIPLRETIVGDVRPILWVVTGAVLLVLLIAVSNVANLMLARSTVRQREIAVRMSVGASRLQLVRQFITESAVLALLGGALGTVLAVSGIAALRWMGPRDLPRLSEIGIDTRALAVTLAVSLASALLFGLAPALVASGANLNESLKHGGRGGESPGRGRLRAILIVAQITLSVLLLIGAGLLIRSVNLLGQVPPGFTAPPERVLTMLVSPSGPRYESDRRENPALSAYWDRLLDRVRLLPGVEAASIAISIPPDRLAFTDGYEIERKPLPPGLDYPAVPVPFVSQDYFATLGIPLLRGRWFDNRDTAKSPLVAVISDTMARRRFPGEDPVGQRLKHGGRALSNPYMEIIGVVGDVKYEGLDGPPAPVYYEVTSQAPDRPMWLLVRTRGDALSLAPAVRQEIRRIDPDVPVDQVGSMAQALSESVSMPRFRSLLMSVFAAAALLLAAIGTYGVMAYSVAQRTQEIGVRMTLGATPPRMLRLVIRQGSRLAILGMALGIGCAFGLTRVLRHMLFGVTPLDPLAFAAAVLLLGTAALIATLVPAVRAARVDPVTVLRHD